MASIDEPEFSDEDASPDCGRREATVEHLDRPCRIVQSHNERTFNGRRLCVHVMRIGLMVYAWAACDSDNFGSLHACFPPSQQGGSCSTSALIAGERPSEASAFAQHIAEATGLAVMASLNADASSAQIRSALERDVIELVQSFQ